MDLSQKQYTKHFDTLIALVTHLANTDFEGRTISAISKNLNLNFDDVKLVLEGFPGFFRKSKNKSEKDEFFYTIHLRYARRRKDGESVSTEPLKPEELSTLLDLISKMVANEAEMTKITLDLDSRFYTNLVTMIAAVIAALAAIAAAVLTAVIK